MQCRHDGRIFSRLLFPTLLHGRGLRALGEKLRMRFRFCKNTSYSIVPASIVSLLNSSPLPGPYTYPLRFGTNSESSLVPFSNRTGQEKFVPQPLFGSDKERLVLLWPCRI